MKEELCQRQNTWACRLRQPHMLDSCLRWVNGWIGLSYPNTWLFLENMLINHEMLCPVSRHMALSDRESQLSDASSLLSNNVGKTIVNHPQNHQFHRWYKPSNMGFSINFLFYPDSFVAISWANFPISRASLISRPLAQGSWDAPRASLKADLSGSPGSDQV